MLILGIETSCDETAAAIIKGKKTRTGPDLEVLSNIVSSQINIHEKYGGVVPEVAAREHVANILPVVMEALQTAGISRKQAPQELGAIAVAAGPGLITSLLSGMETAKILAYAWNLPLIGINHIEGHIYANFIGANFRRQISNSKQIQNSKSKIPNISFPATILTVSGGHTMLVLMKNHGQYRTIGETRDDAAGEAFDKAAQLMGIGYPGGPIISDQAEKFAKKNKLKILNHKSRIKLPRPMLNSNNFDFSFSGLKTALRYALENDKNWQEKIPEYCHEFQQAIIDVLIQKTVKAGQNYKTKTTMLSGGVSANRELRNQLRAAVKNALPESNFIMPDMEFTTDNAAMIAAAGYFRALDKNFTSWKKIKVNCNSKL